MAIVSPVTLVMRKVSSCGHNFGMLLQSVWLPPYTVQIEIDKYAVTNQQNRKPECKILTYFFSNVYTIELDTSERWFLFKDAGPIAA